ncbi:26S proteasome non-ATPase regulatory subunit 9 [Bacillus rossius redtenbacheri]|uniref:26S proteasome non-ATPase regulatory subunit 9 n=1 Tax=Bacillus rossius redtenbacheri TaxID=93214 RepID=UPI002FDEA11F
MEEDFHGGPSRESILMLMDRRSAIEREIDAMRQILQSNNIDMKEPLVDADGFPRQDIDVYQVRLARHRIICLMNDHKALMRQIEQGLVTIHSQIRESGGAGVSAAPRRRESSTPIARVNFVSPDSPAERAGLVADDLIVEFGSVNSDNIKTLQDVAAVVKHSVGRSINLRVLREDRLLSLTLTPGTWSGRGLIGCNIVPVDFVER